MDSNVAGKPRLWRFGPAVFDAAGLRLTVNATAVPVEPRPLALLALLLARSGQLVTKEELLDSLWPGREVTESSLTKCMGRLRAALGEEAQASIRTVHGYGYRIDDWQAADPPAQPLATSPLAAPPLAAPHLAAPTPAALADDGEPRTDGAGPGPGHAGRPAAPSVQPAQGLTIAPAEAPVSAIPVQAPVRVARPGAAGRRKLLRQGIGVAVFLVLAGLVLRQPSSPPPPPPQARTLYLKGLQDWAQRTPEGLNQAVAEFTEALRIAPGYAEAYVGLANCYNLLSEFSAMPAAQAFSLAREAARHAVALNDQLAGAHAALGFALFYGDWDVAAALREYQVALRLEPANPGVHHWYATSLDSIGLHRQALAEIDQALELEPASRAIRADRGEILFHAGKLAEARGVLAALAKEAPAFRSPHTYLAEMALGARDWPAYLYEAALTAMLHHDPAAQAVIKAAADGYAAGGAQGLLHALLQARIAGFAAGNVSAAELAAAYGLSGDTANGMRYLALAIDRRDSQALYLRNDPGLANLVGAPGYAALVASLHWPDGDKP